MFDLEAVVPDSGSDYVVVLRHVGTGYHLNEDDSETEVEEAVNLFLQFFHWPSFLVVAPPGIEPGSSD